MVSKRSVLVVEDALPIRESLCAVLKTHGFEVRGCGDGRSALDAAAENDFHVIITDYRMPHMNGVEVTKHLRMRSSLSLIIGVSLDDRREDFLAAGADAFLQKPYECADIVNLLNAKR